MAPIVERSLSLGLSVQATKLGSGQSLSEAGLQEAAWSFESMVSIVRSLPAGQAVVPAIVDGLHYMDSRAVAALLKDIAKKGLAQRAVEIFDWLRSLPPTHELQQLCDVYTYTTGACLSLWQHLLLPML